MLFQIGLGLRLGFYFLRVGKEFFGDLGGFFFFFKVRDARRNHA